MSENKHIAVSKMKPGQTGKIIEIQGGQGLTTRLSALGIIPGRNIVKISDMLMRGPVTVKIGSTQVAIGYGMADKIIVEPD
ncbi:MAG: ferrous iron transport protein A [Dehalococcoidales bacterium]|nr:MAG: ferrous iron transport protein A [Dehalococcoidales bacterium]